MYVQSVNKVMIIFDPIFIIPAAVVVSILFAIIGGGIYFNEFDTFTLVQSILYGVGVVSVFVGMCYLVPERYENEDVAFRHENEDVESRPSLESSLSFEMATFGSMMGSPRGLVPRRGAPFSPGGRSVQEPGLPPVETKARRKPSAAHIAAQEEKELRRLMNIKSITREDANRAKQHMMDLKMRGGEGDLRNDSTLEKEAEQTKLENAPPATNDPPPPACNDPPPTAPLNAPQRAAIERSRARRATMEIAQARAEAEAEAEDEAAKAEDEAAFNRILEQGGF